jgi:hypothetical protein
MLVWSALKLATAARGTDWTAVIGILGFSLGLFIAVPIYLQRLLHTTSSNTFEIGLQSDLQTLGGNRLNRQVQCLDLVSGCYEALYR